MAEFADVVREAERNAGLTAPDGVPTPPPRKPVINPRWIYAVCVTDDDISDEWPNYFISVPQRGDYVSSKSRRRLEVMAVIHKTDIQGRPFLELELGTTKYTDVSPTSSGGGGDYL